MMMYQTISSISGSGKTYTMQPLPLKASQDILRLMHHIQKSRLSIVCQRL
uniref:Kif4, putative n=1 Tax=Arundo donax TaxID=35708 RepID=A0A0A8YZR6_ARUDO